MSRVETAIRTENGLSPAETSLTSPKIPVRRFEGELSMAESHLTAPWTPLTPPHFPSPVFLPAVGADSQISVVAIIELGEAEKAIAAKAASLGGLPGSPTSDVNFVKGGFVRTYAGCDIYYSAKTGAHEVHGDIRAKYNVLLGPAGVLGLPLTDETGTPDGVGRFNHFVGGSIYWTPHTGPMMVRGAIRDVWASQGWEAGTLRYPVRDEYRMVTYSPATDPATYWSFFENGAILSSKDGSGVAVTADLSPNDMRVVVRRFFDQGFHAKDVNIGLEAAVETLNITGWSYDFWASHPRQITFRLHGFHDNGLAPDTTFEMDVRLTFDLAWQPSFTEPTTKTLAVKLEWIKVTAHGLGSGSVASGVKDGVWESFYPKDGPDPATPWIQWGWKPILDFPTGADLHGNGIDVLGVLVTAGGGLQVLLNPVPSLVGALRKAIAQQKIDAFVAGS